METLLIAIGNPLRRDDGVAHAILQHFPAGPEIELRWLHQLTAEVAAEIAPCRTVVFLDSDLNARRLIVEPLEEAVGYPSLTHASSPQEVVALSRALYGFTGEVWLCRIPGSDFGFGRGLSRQTHAFEQQTVAALKALFRDGPANSF